MNNIPKHVRVSVIIFMPVFWLATIVLVLNLTSPIMAGPAGILVVFLLFYAFVASLTYVLIRSVIVALKMFRKGADFSNAKTLQVACVVALAPVFLVALNTLGKIGVVEVCLVAILVGLACFYAIRRSTA